MEGEIIPGCVNPCLVCYTEPQLRYTITPQRSQIVRLDGISRGFGFVTYSDTAPVDKCLQMGSHQIGGKRVEVKRAVPKEGGADGQRGGGGGGAYAMGGRGGGMNNGGMRGGMGGGYGGGRGYGQGMSAVGYGMGGGGGECFSIV